MKSGFTKEVKTAKKKVNMANNFFFCDIIYGTLYGKANSRKVIINKRTGKPMVIKQDGAFRFQKDFMLQVKKIPEPYEGKVSLSACVYYPDNRQDLEIELLKDCIEKAGIIKNDKQIVEYSRVQRRISKDRPRVIFALRDFECHQKKLN